MKTIFVLFSAFILLSTNLKAQEIDLPMYKVGQYEVDTILSYYGSFFDDAIGYIRFDETYSSNFVTGMEFKLIVDKTDTDDPDFKFAGEYRKDGIRGSIKKGDTIALPLTIQIYFGTIGFQVIVEGTPRVAGESYSCAIGTSIELDVWSYVYEAKGNETCIVDVVQSVSEEDESLSFNVQPNPFDQTTTIQFDNLVNEVYTLIVYDFVGIEVMRIEDIESNVIDVDKGDLQAGTYFFKLQNEVGIKATGKLMIE